NTQETLLGTYTDSRGKEKTVVACGDFTDGGKKLIEFAHLKNTCINSEQSGYGTELSSILEAIEEQTLLPPDKLRDFFWDMFIADAFLGNFDRHNGNWGILVDEHMETAEIAPIYDCGSCLYPQLAAEDMQSVLDREDEINRRIYTYPASTIEENGKKVSYFEFISSLKNEDCNLALKRIHSRINLEGLYKIIEETPTPMPIQKEFYKIILHERKSKILDYSIEQLFAMEKGSQEQTI
ncbi:MAG: CtkA family protein, partial [Clostridiales bacterium]|nr:CtkA family protein [Clostridiales bacterium]